MKINGEGGLLVFCVVQLYNPGLHFFAGLCMHAYMHEESHVCVITELYFFFTVLEVSGADGLVRETISWMAKRSLSRCRGLLMPISRWISVSERADMMAPLFTLARQAATYHAGIPTHSW